jgi:hypothetical protein
MQDKLDEVTADLYLLREENDKFRQEKATLKKQQESLIEARSTSCMQARCLLCQQASYVILDHVVAI